MLDLGNNSFPKVTVILRGYDYEQVRCVVKAMVGSRLGAVEIAMNTPGATSTIERIAKEFGDKILVGAGTVTTVQRAREAVAAGAQFMLSPIGFSREIFSIAHKAGVVTVPAAFSPTEIIHMFDMGADIVKVFPAGRAGSKYFSDIQAPLGSMPLMAVGGVNGENVQEFFDAGCTFAGIGSGIFKKDDLFGMNEGALKRQIAEFEKKVRW